MTANFDSTRVGSSQAEAPFTSRLSAWLMPLLMVLALPACISFYRIDVRQGNHVSQEMVSQLRPGMTEEQVRFIMGTPLLQDPFRTNRWDYVYRYSPRGKLEESRRVTLVFVDGKLSSVEGDVVAAMTPAPEAASPPAAKN